MTTDELITELSNYNPNGSVVVKVDNENVPVASLTNQGSTTVLLLESE